MQLSRTLHLPLASQSQARLTKRLLPLFIAAFSQGLILWAPIEKVFLNSLGFDQAALGLMAACYTSLIPLLDLTSGILADRWSRKGVLILASLASMLNALLGGLSHDVLTYLVSTLFFGAQVGPFFSTFFAQATTAEFLAMLVKSAIFGAMIAIVCCYKGLTASGGAEGVGRAVNQAVVIAFLGIGAIDYVFTQTLLATHPILNTPR